ncbi:DUF4407 domain-containing protein [Stappia sp.]|uniref:DUF4407 domain-containing protein n=1 Tax=Stappia sp. TaxID=1870903 RepID=UPI003C7DF3FF
MMNEMVQQKKIGFLTDIFVSVAGADKDILIESPHADRNYIVLIGIMLLVSGSLLFIIGFGAVLASGVAVSTVELIYLGIICAFVALTVMMIDRAFIMADWFCYSSQTYEESLRTPSSFQKFRRIGAICLRILLSVAIAFVFSTLAETYLYHDELNKEIERRHLKANADIFAKLDYFEKVKDDELNAARENMQALEEAYQAAAKELQNVVKAPVVEDPTLSELKRQIADANTQIFQKREAREFALRDEQKFRDYADEERYGDTGQSITGRELTGRAGCGVGSKCQRALNDADDARQRSVRLQSEIDALVVERDADVDALVIAQNAALASKREVLASQEVALEEASAARDAEKERLERLEREFETTLTNRAEFLVNQPGFIPKSDGLAARFQALHDIYNTYGIYREAIALKVFIMMLEMAPFLVKILASPRTFYAIELNRRIANMSYYSEIDRLEKNAEFLQKDYEAFQARNDWERRAREDDFANEVFRNREGAA